CLARKFLGQSLPGRKASKSPCFEVFSASGSANCAGRNQPVFNPKVRALEKAPSERRGNTQTGRNTAGESAKLQPG
ncbi:MAG: hypothetical protein ACK57U_10665, partial [Planctomycetota bacterium]